MIPATHAAFATGLYLGGSALFEYPAGPVGWGLAVFFSLLPDIDLPTSRIDRPLFWLSVRLERQHGHRTVTHSLVAGVASPLFAVGPGRLVLGHTRRLLVPFVAGHARRARHRPVLAGEVRVVSPRR